MGRAGNQMAARDVAEVVNAQMVLTAERTRMVANVADIRAVMAVLTWALLTRRKPASRHVAMGITRCRLLALGAVMGGIGGRVAARDVAMSGSRGVVLASRAVVTA